MNRLRQSAAILTLVAASSTALFARAQDGAEAPAYGDDIGLPPLDVQADLPPVTATTESPAAGPDSAAPLDAQLAATEQTIARERAHQAALARARAALPEAEQALERALQRDVRALYRLRRGGLLPLAGGLPALVNHASRVAHLERMATQTSRKLRDVRARGAALAKEAVELEGKLSALEREARALESKRASRAAEAAAAAALTAQRAQMEARAEREADSAARVSYGLTLVGGDERERTSLSAQRGLLALPVAAASSIAPDPEGEGRRKGLLFETTPGASVRAAADGRVASVERGGDGVVVVLDHGQRYQTIYAGLESSDLEPGDAVSKSARLGSVGSRPVKFEVRRGSRSQDARSYLGL